MERDYENSQIKSELEDISEVNYEDISDSFIKTEVFHNDYEEVKEDQIRTRKRKRKRKSNPAHDNDPLANSIRTNTNVDNKYKLKNQLVLCLKKLTETEIEMYQELTKKYSYGTKKWKNVKIKCKICGKILKSHINMLSHLKFHHMGLSYKYKCNACHKKFYWKKNLKDHKKITNHKVKTPNSFPCPKCEDIFMLKYHLDRHLRTIHDSSKLPCNQCDKSFRLPSRLSRHVNMVHLRIGVDKRKVCPVCEKSISANYLKEHIRIHSETPASAFPCPKCAKTFKLKYYLSSHIRTVHSDSSRFPCHQCYKSFKLKPYLTSHVKKVHLGSITRYPCDVCNKTFASPKGARVHKLRVHMKIKPKSANKLKVEQSEIDEPIECKICFKMVKSSIMKNHGKYHSGKNPFLCTICLKSTPSRGALYNHNSVWHNQKLATTWKECPVCDKSILAYNLDKHIMRKHSDYQPNQFKCSKCPKAFKYRINLERHEKSHDDTSVLRKENPDPKEIESDCILGL